MKTKEIVEKRINDIWEEFSTNYYCQIPPLCVSEIPENGIVFIGINPSLDDKDKERLLNCVNKKVEFYTVDGNHRYFNKFPEIAKKVNLPWGHIDLLYIRETKQEGIKELLKDTNGVDFIYKQLMVTKEILNRLLSNKQPIIFVVNNTLARELLGKDRPELLPDNQPHWMDLRFVKDDNLGTYTCSGHPFFFTSMLTGQRALDKGSYDRLNWHINFVKEKLKIS